MAAFYDVHAHAFHPAIAAKVLTNLTAHYQVEPIGTGLVHDLLAREKAAGIDRVFVHCAATAPAQVIPANNWAMAMQREHPEITAFGTLHPDDANWEANLERLRKAGIRGIKLHPDFQGYRLDDPRLLPMLEQARDHFLFMVHVGDRPPPDQNPSCPYKLAALLDKLPGLRVIAAHLGGWMQWEHALTALIGREDLYIDTSASLAYVDDATLKAIFAGHPRERILFGSDYPLFEPGKEIALLQQRLNLSDAELEKILSAGSRLFED